ncbi:MAG: type IX secretion system membrane protein PorP/SprF [Flavobacteriales bacterium]
MKLKFIFPLIFLFSTLYVKSQQLPMYSQYLTNDFTINPAVAGSKSFFPIQISTRTQWSSLGSIAPQTNTLSYHMPIAYNSMGVGGIIMQDKTGPYKQLSFQLSYAYHIQLNRKETTTLALGLSGIINQQTLEMGELDFHNPDPDFEGGSFTKIVPDANVGAYLYSKSFFISLSSHQLFESTFKEGISSIFGDNYQVRHYFASTGYTFDIYSDLKVEPSILIKGTETSPVQMDINTRIIIDDAYWAGISLRSSQSLVAILGFKLGALNLSYSYDYGINSISTVTSGSHEISLGFNINDKRNRRHSYYW